MQYDLRPRALSRRRLENYDSHSYRPISVGSIIRKLYCSALNARVAKLKTDLKQREFKSVEGGPINLGIVKLAAARAHEEGREISYASLDVAKAFDSVNHKRILETLGKRGVPRKFLEVINVTST